MQVVEEIIDYLFYQNLLTDEELSVLNGNGLLAGTAAGAFYDESRLERLDDPYRDERERGETDRLIDQVEARFDRMPARRRSAGPRSPALLLAKEVVCDRLRVCFASGAAQLRPLLMLASALGTTMQVSKALQTLIGVPLDELARAIAATVRCPGQGFRDVWDAATWRAYRDIQREGEHGPAAVAYQAILGGAATGDLGRYLSELTPGLAELMQLIQVQRRILGAIGALMKASPELFDRPLFVNARDGACYWALTIAITALLKDSSSPMTIDLWKPARPASEYCDLMPGIFEDALAVSQLHVESLVQTAECLTDLRCPAGWNAGYDEGTYYARRRPKPAHQSTGIE